MDLNFSSTLFGLSKLLNISALHLSHVKIFAKHRVMAEIIKIANLNIVAVFTVGKTLKEAFSLASKYLWAGD